MSSSIKEEEIQTNIDVGLGEGQIFQEQTIHRDLSLREQLLNNPENLNDNVDLIDFQAYRKSKVYASQLCFANNCHHIPFKIFDSRQIILDYQTHTVVGVPKKLKGICSCEYRLAGQLKQCQKCGLTFQIKESYQNANYSFELPTRCPGCQLYQCKTCKVNVSLYGDMELRSCVACQIKYFNCKNRTIRNIDLICQYFMGFLTVCFYLFLLILYTVFMICILPFYVFYRVIKKSIRANYYPDVNIILQIFIFPFYLVYLICYILIYYTVCLIPKAFKYYVDFLNRCLFYDDD